MFRAVLDANVYVSALMRPLGPPGRLFELFLRKSAFELIVSPAIADEIARALEYPAVRKRIRGREQVASWLDDLLLLADLVEDRPLDEAACRDADDDKYLSAALVGRATFVVTGDRALLDLQAYRGILIISPRRFLDTLD